MSTQSAANAHRLRSVPWTVGEGLLVFLLPWVALPVVAFIVLLLLAPDFRVARELLSALERGSPQANFALVLLDAIGSFAVIRHYLRKHKVGWRNLGLRRFNVTKSVLYIVGLYAAFALTVSVLLILVQVLVPNFNPDQPQANEFTGLAPQYHIYSLLALVIIPPLVEEPVFRGFLFPAFSKRFGLAVGAILSSILFGLAHLQANVSVYTFVVGLVLCFLYVRLGSIIPGIAFHMLNNYIAYTALNQVK